MTSRMLVLDCDTGADDALAVLMAIGLAPSVDLIGVTTVHGNTSSDVAYDNTRRVLESAGFAHVPVIPGADCELRLLGVSKRQRTQGCGEQGKSFTFLPAAREELQDVAQSNSAADWLVETVQKHPGLELVLTGPLTNIALALRQDPTLAQRVGNVTIMGGCFGVSWAYSEFNFACDAMAAAEVLAADWQYPPTVVGLNLTCQALLPMTLIQRIAASPHRVAGTAAAIFQHIDPRGWNECSGDGWEMFDACALAAWVDPSLFKCSTACTVWINDKSGYTSIEEPPITKSSKRGKSIPVQIRVAESIDSSRFFDLVAESLHA